MTKPILSIDIDDVLAPSAQAFVKFSNKMWGTNLTIDDYDEHWSKVWQIDDEAEINKRIEQIDAADFYGKECPHPQDRQSLEALNRLKYKFRIITLSSRRVIFKDGTIEWLNYHYPNIFDDYVFAGIWDDISKLDEFSKRINATKGDVLKSLGVVWHIDDQPKHCYGASGAGVKSILFGDYAWNRKAELRDNIFRASDWLEVEQIIRDES